MQNDRIEEWRGEDQGESRRKNTYVLCTGY